MGSSLYYTIEIILRLLNAGHNSEVILMLLTNVWKQFLSISAKLSLFQNESFTTIFFDRSKGMNRILSRQAFFADGTPFYRLYTSDGTGYGVRLRFRTAKDNAELVTVVTDM